VKDINCGLQAMNQLKEGNDELSKTQNFICGFGAGLFAKLCCHPLDVIKKRYQVEPLLHASFWVLVRD